MAVRVGGGLIAVPCGPCAQVFNSLQMLQRTLFYFESVLLAKLLLRFVTSSWPCISLPMNPGYQAVASDQIYMLTSGKQSQDT